MLYKVNVTACFDDKEIEYIGVVNAENYAECASKIQKEFFDALISMQLEEIAPDDLFLIDNEVDYYKDLEKLIEQYSKDVIW